MRSASSSLHPKKPLLVRIQHRMLSPAQHRHNIGTTSAHAPFIVLTNGKNVFAEKNFFITTEPICWVTGQCLGNISHIAVQVSTAEQCLESCQQDPECRWFTHFPQDSTCQLMLDCSILDESCEDCISGEYSCEIKKGTNYKVSPFRSVRNE